MNALKKKSMLTYLKEGGIYVVLLVLLAIIIFQDQTFLNLMNLSNILTQSSVRIIIALGVAGLIVTQGTDLSVGRQVGLAAVVAATLLQSMDSVNKVFPDMHSLPIPVVILIVCAIGGMLEAGRIGRATYNLGFMYELDAIAACVVGGVSFSGGVGTVLGVVTGVIIFTVINYDLTYIDRR